MLVSKNVKRWSTFPLHEEENENFGVLGTKTDHELGIQLINGTAVIV